MQIAGSADPETTREVLGYAHSLVEQLATALAQSGATFVLQAGGDPIGKASELPLIFDWTAIAAAAGVLNSGAAIASGAQGKFIASVLTHKSDTQIPDNRRPVWQDLLAADAVRLEYLEGGWTSGAVRRERQAQLGDVLVILSGGEGVEHLARLYAAEGKPIIPLDLNLGSSTHDGRGGAASLHEKALAHPDEFFRLRDPASGSALLARTKTQGGTVDVGRIVEGLMELISGLRDPEAFYVRLLNKTHPDFAAVEAFFRDVVDPVVDQLGFSKAEMGEVETEEAFMNVEIFARIHHSALVVTDLTGVRPNCTMELGYAFGRLKSVILTARDGTQLPFDPEAIDTHLWNTTDPAAARMEALLKYRTRTAQRPPLVRPRGIN